MGSNDLIVSLSCQVILLSYGFNAKSTDVCHIKLPARWKWKCCSDFVFDSEALFDAKRNKVYQVLCSCFCPVLLNTRLCVRLRTSLGLQFRPHELAAGAIYLAAKFLKINLPQEGGKPWWTEFEVTPSILEGRQELRFLRPPSISW